MGIIAVGSSQARLIWETVGILTETICAFLTRELGLPFEAM
jgi:hypothetical protein